jgi:dynein assembly factor 3
LPSVQVDWDYSMRLSERGNPGRDPKEGSIINPHQFRAWRRTGLAFQVRDATYTEPNRTLLSTARGRTKEFKDR